MATSINTLYKKMLNPESHSKELSKKMSLRIMNILNMFTIFMLSVNLATASILTYETKKGLTLNDTVNSIYEYSLTIDPLLELLR